MNPKVTVAAIAGAVTILIVYLVELFSTVMVPPEVASAITVMVMVAVGYMVPATWQVPVEPKPSDGA